MSIRGPGAIGDAGNNDASRLYPLPDETVGPLKKKLEDFSFPEPQEEKFLNSSLHTHGADHDDVKDAVPRLIQNTLELIEAKERWQKKENPTQQKTTIEEKLKLIRKDVTLIKVYLAVLSTTQSMGLGPAPLASLVQTANPLTLPVMGIVAYSLYQAGIPILGVGRQYLFNMSSTNNRKLIETKKLSFEDLKKRLQYFFHADFRIFVIDFYDRHLRRYSEKRQQEAMETLILDEEFCLEWDDYSKNPFLSPLRVIKKMRSKKNK